MDNIDGFANREFAEQFKKDLNENDNSHRKLISIDAVSAQQLFALLGMNNPGCDADGDNYISGDAELKCLNIIWKSYVPPDDC